MIIHLILIIASLFVTWRFASSIIHAVERVAHHYGKSGFFIAFVVLGILSSVTEFSVLFNSTLTGTPAISAGNLVGASLVLMTCIVPLVAIANKGISLSSSLSVRDLGFTLATIALPAIILMDGTLSSIDSLLLVITYCSLVFHLNAQKPITVEKAVDISMNPITPHLSIDLGKIIIGGLLILFAGHILVRETSLLALQWGIPGSLVALIGLSLGTNVPELSIALSAIKHNKESVAFGDYLGSASANTLLMGILGFLNQSPTFSRIPFIEASSFTLIGLILLFIFTSSARRLSRQEGILLLIVYLFFIILQIITAIGW